MYLDDRAKEEILERIEDDFLREDWEICVTDELDDFGLIEPSEFTIYINPVFNNTEDEYFITLAHEVLHWLFPEEDEDEIEDMAIQISEDYDFRKLMEGEFGTFKEVVSENQ